MTHDMMNALRRNHPGVRRVLVTGLNVVVKRDNQKWTGPTPHWKILELFCDELSDCQFGAIQTGGETASSICDMDLRKDLRVVPLNRSPYRGYRRFTGSPTVYSSLIRLARQTDYFYIRLPSWLGIQAWRCAQWFDRPYWLSIHGAWEEILKTRERSATGPLQRLWYASNRVVASRSLRRAIARARLVFFVGHTLHRRYGNSRVPSIIYEDVTHTAADVWPFAPRQLYQEAVTILFVGEITKAKGVDCIIQASARLAEQGTKIRVIFVGRGPLESWLSGLRIAGVEVTTLGWVSQGRQFDELFRQSTLLALPSWAEGVPRSVIEAMVRATPVIASRVGDTPRLLGHGSRGWIVEPGDVAAIVDAVHEITTSPEIRREKVERGIAYAKEHDRRFWKSTIRDALQTLDPMIVTNHDDDPNSFA